MVVDDIEDDAILRRGKPCLHKTFGTDTAINAGNAMYFLPLKILLKKKNLTNGQKIRLMDIYCEEMINVHFGQSLDIDWHKNPKKQHKHKRIHGDVQTENRISRENEHSFCLRPSQQEQKIEKAYGKFAESVGIAFQIKDDILDLTGDKKFGKSFGNDITEGKFSLPVIFALKNLEKDKKENLLKILKLHTRNIREIKEAIKIIKESKAVEKSMNYADRLGALAWNELERYIPKK